MAGLRNLFDRLTGKKPVKPQQPSYLRGTRVDEDLQRLLRDARQLADRALGSIYRVPDEYLRRRLRGELIDVLAELKKADAALTQFMPGAFEGAKLERNRKIERQVNEAVDAAEKLSGQILQMPARVARRYEDAPREEIGRTSAERFLAGTLTLGVSSSWLLFARYHPDDEQLTIVFRDGWDETYGNISLQEAKSFLTAGSKGRWLHANILGNRNRDGTWQHKKPRVRRAA